MNMRSANNPYGSFSEGTDKRIGDAYPVIQAVYAKLAELTYIAENAHNLQPGQIELRHVAETKTLEWKYSNEADWNVLVVYEDFSAINSTVLAAAVSTAADLVQTGLDRVQTGLDKVATAADRIQTGIDSSTATAKAAEALASLNDFKGRWYGALASNPTLDPLGNALTVGDAYFNSTSNSLLIWNGSTWQASNINMVDLANSGGASLIGYHPAGAGAVVTTVDAKLKEDVSFFDVLTNAEQLAVINNDYSVVSASVITGKLQELINGDVRSIIINTGYYKITEPLRIPSYRQLLGNGPSLYSSVFYPDLSIDWQVTFPKRGVIETTNFDWPNGYPVESVKPDFWTQGSLEGFQVRCHFDELYATYPLRVPDYGIAIWCANEETNLRRLSVHRARLANIFMGGYMSVGHMESCSGWNSPSGYGLLMSNHPDTLFAPSVSAADGGLGNGGSIRLLGFSGDLNSAGLIGADGTQIVDLIGLKSEYNNPAIHSFGSASATTRQRWNITGFRHEAGTAITAPRDFFRITAGIPQVIIGAGGCYNATNILSDVVNGVVIAKQAEGFFVVYDYQQTMELRGRSARLPGVVLFQSDAQLDSPIFTCAHHGYGTPSTTQLRYSWDVRDVGSEQIRMRTGLTPRTVLSIDSASSGNGLAVWAWNGTTTEPVLKTSTADNLAVLTLGVTPTNRLRFYGTGVSYGQQTITGSKGGNAALADLITKLANLGLIVDTTT